MSKHVVARVEEIPPGGRKLVQVAGRDVLVLNLGGQFYGLLDRCPHNGGSLCKGTITSVVESPEPGVYNLTRPGAMIRCPWHGWAYDIRTGQSWCEPDRTKTVTFPVAVAHGQDLVEGPYVAETVPVSVEADYVVVEA